MKNFLAIALLGSVLASGSLFADEAAADVVASEPVVAQDSVVPAEVKAEAQSGFVSRLVNHIRPSSLSNVVSAHPYVAYGVAGTALVGVSAAALYRYCPCIAAQVNALLGIKKTAKKAYL